MLANNWKKSTMHNMIHVKREGLSPSLTVDIPYNMFACDALYQLWIYLIRFPEVMIHHFFFCFVFVFVCFAFCWFSFPFLSLFYSWVFSSLEGARLEAVCVIALPLVVLLSNCNFEREMMLLKRFALWVCISHSVWGCLAHTAAPAEPSATRNNCSYYTIPSTTWPTMKQYALVQYIPLAYS